MERIRELRLDVYGGCFNNRPIRGGSRPSLHAWGIAIDMDPERNTLYMSAPEAVFSGPEYDAFWSIVEKEEPFPGTREELRLDALPVRQAVSVRKPQAAPERPGRQNVYFRLMP